MVIMIFFSSICFTFYLYLQIFGNIEFDGFIKLKEKKIISKNSFIIMDGNRHFSYMTHRNIYKMHFKNFNIHVCVYSTVFIP